MPPHTDLNKYFEIMNNRGEQLEQQDIVKSRLIEIMPPKKRDAFARIWDACSDMSGYVQMHFEKSEREHYFDKNWTWLPDKSTTYYLPDNKAIFSRRLSIDEIANEADATSTYAENRSTPDDGNIRFESFVTFRHFLLHVLRIFELEESGEAYNDEIDWRGERIDDKKLIRRFESAFPRGPESRKAVERFGICLLRCRYLFDNYVLKREFNGDDSEGKWSVKMLGVTRQKRYGNLSAYYKDGKKPRRKPYASIHVESHIYLPDGYALGDGFSCLALF